MKTNSVKVYLADELAPNGSFRFQPYEMFQIVGNPKVYLYDSYFGEIITLRESDVNTLDKMELHERQRYLIGAHVFKNYYLGENGFEKF